MKFTNDLYTQIHLKSESIAVENLEIDKKKHDKKNPIHDRL